MCLGQLVWFNLWILDPEQCIQYRNQRKSTASYPTRHEVFIVSLPYLVIEYTYGPNPCHLSFETVMKSVKFVSWLKVYDHCRTSSCWTIIIIIASFYNHTRLSCIGNTETLNLIIILIGSRLFASLRNTSFPIDPACLLISSLFFCKDRIPMTMGIHSLHDIVSHHSGDYGSLGIILIFLWTDLCKRAGMWSTAWSRVWLR